jgi:FAD/FMN-containing dehydrogenase
LPALDAAEVFFAAGLELVSSVFELPLPFARSHAAYVLAECAWASDPTGDLAAAVDGLRDVEDVAVAGPAAPGRRAALWRYREAHTEAINTLGAPHKLDVTVPVGALPDFADAAGPAVAAVAPDAACWLFGHAADGNLHVNVTGVAPDDNRVDDAVLHLVARFGGSSSAEHGIGTAKKRWLHLNRTDAEIAAMRRIKAALDPDGILNPNVLLP